MSCRPVCAPQYSSQWSLWYCPVCSINFPSPTVAQVIMAPGNWGPIRGKRTYQVRHALHRMGGLWDKGAKVWWVPRGKMNAAIHHVRTGPDDAADPVPSPSSEPWLCWECGDILKVPQLAGPTEDLNAYWCGECD